MKQQLNTLKLYCKLMDEVKARDAAIRFLLKNEQGIPFGTIQTESIYLQIRKILELIALGSLVSHKEQYSKHYSLFYNHYNARKILESIEKINPDFYPKPTKEVQSHEDGVLPDFLDSNAEYLKIDEFITLYNICGSLMHAYNPYKQQPNIKTHSTKIKSWMSKIVMLLNSHRIQLLNEDWFYLIHMKESNSNVVKGYIFKRVDQ